MNDFSQGSIRKCIMSQAVPLAMAQLVQLLYNVVDRIYIGHLPGIGSMALAGIGLIFPLAALIAAFTNLFGTGGVTLFSIARGEKKEEEAEALMGNVCVLLAVTSVVLFLCCYFFRKPVLYLFGASDISYPYADEYLRVYLWGTLFVMLGAGLNGFINAQGFPRMGMLTIILGAVLNIILDPILIFGLDMGITGAALATVISQAVSAAWVLRFLTGKKALLVLKRKDLRWNWGRTRQIITLGTSGFVMQASNCLVYVVCNKTLQTYGGSLGDLYVGIMTIINSVRDLAFLPVVGISNGAQPVLGYNYGAREMERVKNGIRFITIVGLVYTISAWLLIWLFPKALFGIFSDDELVLTYGPQAMNLYFFGFCFMAFQFAGQTVFQALGRAKEAIFFSLLRKVFIVVPLTLLLPVWGLGINGVFLAEPVSNILGGGSCFLMMYKKIYKKL